LSERESFLAAFHAASPGITPRAFARSGVYERFAARVPRTGRILDLACGDGTLTRLLGPGAIGVDISPEPGPTLRARAQQLPFRDGAFTAVACELAFMLFDDIERVVAELHRVVASGGTFVALVGGGPVANEPDAFHAFVGQLVETGSVGSAFGDRRANSEEGWRSLFKRGWSAPVFERWPLDLSGSFDDVWAFLGSSYQLRAEHAETVRAGVRARYPGERVPCAVACYCASVIRR
jgi:SAM-dependent methyltransferase